MNYHDYTTDRKKGMKVCRQCGYRYPNTTEYFNRNKQTGDGLHYYCRNCRKKYMVEYHKRRGRA